MNQSDIFFTPAKADFSIDLTSLAPDAPVAVLLRIKAYLEAAPEHQTASYYRVLGAICLHGRNESGACWPGHERLGAMADRHPNSVARELRVLKAHGVITVVHDHPDHPEREWVYVIENWAAFWVEKSRDTADQNSVGAEGTRKSLSPTSSAPHPPAALWHSNAPAAINAERQQRRDEERLLADVANADEDTKEQAYACLNVGIDVPMVRWLLKRYRRGRNWIRTVVQRALKARHPAGFMVAAICGKYAAVSDVETYRHHQSRSRRPQRPTQKQDVVQEARTRFFGLSFEDREAVKGWALGNYDSTTHEGRVLRRGDADSLVWLVLAQGMREVFSC